MTRGILLLAAAMAVQAAWCDAPVRERRNFDDQWRFHKGDARGAEKPAFADASWRKLRLPHDWSIEGPYSADNASGTGYLPGGIGWYRKSFTLPETAKGRKVFIEFDGVYRDSDVWINGQHLGHRPYGYSSFEYDLSPYVNFGAKANLLAVRVDHSEIADSRFYTGSGIYRHVWLTIAQPVYVAHWGTYVHTPVVSEAEALVSVETRVMNESADRAPVRLMTTLQDAAGNNAATMTAEHTIAPGESYTFVQQGAVEKPKLWSTTEPELYTAVTHVFAGPALSDELHTPFGIRNIRFDPNHGFFLNGKPEKIKGVCLHHDLGALGAAFSAPVLERRLKALKALGVNAIRCSHNPMAPEEYDLCDRLGLLVMDEAFDEWTAGKNKWVQGWNMGKPAKAGYNEAFEKWSGRDLEDMILRDRNHPSIVMWSIGNEIDYPGDPFGHPRGRNGFKPGMLDANLLPLTARRLISIVKGLDGTRPVTQALADTLASNATGLASLLDVVGYNYLQQHYASDHATYPERVILDSENGHSLGAWRAAASEFVVGQFLWTGVDYLGESGRYPARGSSAGLLDLCGFRKPDSYLREALWSDRPMVYAGAREARPPRGPQTDFNTGPRPGRLVEHWNWSGDSRKTIDVDVYTNCASAELRLNGKSLGEKPVTDRLQPVLRWEVPNEPGVVRVVGKTDGKEVATFELATAGPADHLELLPDRSSLRADDEDFASIEIRVVDAAGRRVFDAQQPIEIQVTGAGSLVAVDSGDIRDTNPVQAAHRKPYEGRILALVRAGSSPGTITVRATSAGVKAGEIRMITR
jgi:beta-galactosidase